MFRKDHLEIPDACFLPTSLPRGLSSWCCKRGETHFEISWVKSSQYMAQTWLLVFLLGHLVTTAAMMLSHCLWNLALFGNFHQEVIWRRVGTRFVFEYLKGDWISPSPQLDFPIFKPIDTNAFRRSRGIVNVSPEVCMKIFRSWINEASTLYLQHMSWGWMKSFTEGFKQIYARSHVLTNEMITNYNVQNSSYMNHVKQPLRKQVLIQMSNRLEDGQLDNWTMSNIAESCPAMIRQIES